MKNKKIYKEAVKVAKELVNQFNSWVKEDWLMIDDECDGYRVIAQHTLDVAAEFDNIVDAQDYMDDEIDDQLVEVGDDDGSNDCPWFSVNLQFPAPNHEPVAWLESGEYDNEQKLIKIAERAWNGETEEGDEAEIAKIKEMYSLG